MAYAYDIAGRLIFRQDSASPAELDFYGGAGSQLVEATGVSGSSSAWASRLKFQMAPQDPKLGVYALGPRLLDPTVGRFTSADNWVASGADLALQADPLTGNRYLYAGANPAGMVDNGYGFCLLGHVHGNPNGPCVGSHEAKKVISVISASSPLQIPTSSRAVVQDLNTLSNPIGSTSLTLAEGAWHDISSTYHECRIEAWIHCGIGVGNIGLQVATAGDLTEVEGAFAAVDEGEAAVAEGTAASAVARGGESAAAATGREVHAEFDQQLRNLNKLDPRFEPGLRSGPFRPDGFFEGDPIELKPDTPSGLRAGQAQLGRYIRAFGANQGYLVTYDSNGAFRIAEVVKP